MEGFCIVDSFIFGHSRRYLDLVTRGPNIISFRVDVQTRNFGRPSVYTAIRYDITVYSASCSWSEEKVLFMIHRTR